MTLSAKHIPTPAKKYKPSPQVLGSSRFASGGIDSEGRYIRQQTIVEATPEEFEGQSPAPTNFQGQTHVLQRGLKSYELTNHLGNVMATVSDRKRQSALSITALPIELGNECFPSIIGPLLPASAKFFLPDVRSVQDYEPFGSPMPGRQSLTSGGYRYGFNGMEKDDEIAGTGNSYTADFWQYDSRLARRWNVDPLSYSWQSTFAAFNNNPVYFIDPLGNISFPSRYKGDNDPPPKLSGYTLPEVVVKPQNWWDKTKSWIGNFFNPKGGYKVTTTDDEFTYEDEARNKGNIRQGNPSHHINDPNTSGPGGSSLKQFGSNLLNKSTSILKKISDSFKAAFDHFDFGQKVGGVIENNRTDENRDNEELPDSSIRYNRIFYPDGTIDTSIIYMAPNNDINNLGRSRIIKDNRK